MASSPLVQLLLLAPQLALALPLPPALPAEVAPLASAPLPPAAPPPASFSCLFVQRENKLLRAGFEGRKQGFIETPKRAAAPAAAAK